MSEVFDGQHEPLIEVETWEEARRLAAAHARSPGGGRGRQTKGRHLFVAGHLRCGECGGAMIPRTVPNRKAAPYEVYRCYNRIRDPASCSQGTLRRADVDSAVYIWFEQVALDVDATRRAIAEMIDRKLAELRALRAQAERQRREAESALQRIERDYTSGDLGAGNYERLSGKLAEELRGAQAEELRLLAREREVEQGEWRTAEQETIRYLAELREAVIGRLRDATSLESVRAALRRLFESFTVRRDPEGINPSHFVIEPQPSPEALARLAPANLPIDPEKSLVQAESGEGGGLHNKYGNGLPLHYPDPGPKQRPGARAGRPGRAPGPVTFRRCRPRGQPGSARAPRARPGPCTRSTPRALDPRSA